MLKRILFSRRGKFLLTAVLLLISGITITLKNKQYFAPGLLSAAQTDGVYRKGYASHANFEKECGYCHGSLHYVTEDRCQGCHYEIEEQRLQEDSLHGRLPATIRCQTCHAEHQGRDADITEIGLENWDHGLLAAFDLELHQTNYDGQPMECEDCHENGRLDAETIDCISCHETDDAVLMNDHLALYGTDCMSCHNGHGQMAAFDHEVIYSLTAAHAKADCATCHADQFFAGTARTCEGCHEEPQIHVGIFGTDCARCHAVAAWSPAHLVQHTFVLAHGSDESIPCQTCHQDNYTNYPCYTCHDMYEVRLRHNQNEIITTNNCISCHPTGRLSNDHEIEHQVNNGGETAVFNETPPAANSATTSSSSTTNRPHTTLNNTTSAPPNAGLGDGKKGN